MIIWFFSSLILNLAFNGLLLNTYFFIKSKPVVNTLQDIRNNKQLLIDGHYEYLSYMSKINKFDIDDILERMNQDKIHLPNMTNTLEHIINGKGIGLSTTGYIKTLLNLARFYNEKLFVSENKYLPDYQMFFVFKYQKFTKLIEFW